MAAAVEREIFLLVAKNELVKFNRRVKVTAVDLSDLLAQLAGKLNVSPARHPNSALSLVQKDGTPINSLADIADRSTVMLCSTVLEAFYPVPGAEGAADVAAPEPSPASMPAPVLAQPEPASGSAPGGAPAAEVELVLEEAAEEPAPPVSAAPAPMDRLELLRAKMASLNSRRRDCPSAVPHSTFSRCCNTDKKGVPSE